jgi:hypothetical protein
MPNLGVPKLCMRGGLLSQIIPVFFVRFFRGGSLEGRHCLNRSEV